MTRPRHEPRNQYHEPPAPPDWWDNAERERSGHRTDRPVSIHGAHEEAIGARREAGVRDRALEGWRAPIIVRAFELILVAQRAGSPDADAGKIDLQIVLIRTQLRGEDFALPKRRHRVINTGDV